jgi:hypothetical protein
MKTLPEPPKMTPEERAELVADLEIKAHHWERKARTEPADVAYWCLDYAKHIRTLMELHRLDSLDDIT